MAAAPYKPTLRARLQIPSALGSSTHSAGSSEGGNPHGRPPRFKMLCSRCLLPVLAFYLLLEVISAAVLPGKLRNKRELSWFEQEIFQRLLDGSEHGDLSVGDAGETGRGLDGRPAHSAPEPSEPVARQNQFQYQRRDNEKRRKVAPLDSIGRFQMSSHRNPKDEPDSYREDYGQ